MEGPRKQRARRSRREGQAPGLVQSFQLPGAACVFIAFFCYCGIEYTAGLWATSYLNLYHGVDEQTAASCASLFYLGITAGRFVTGFIADRFGDRNMIRMGLLVIVCGCVIVALPINAALLPMAGIIIIGLGCAPVYPAFIHATPALFGAQNSQAIIGIQMACAYVGSLLLPPLFGPAGGAHYHGAVSLFHRVFCAPILCNAVDPVQETEGISPRPDTFSSAAAGPWASQGIAHMLELQKNFYPPKED